jgi:hypothetical protein
LIAARGAGIVMPVSRAAWEGSVSLRSLLLIAALVLFGFWWSHPGVVVVESEAFDTTMLARLSEDPPPDAPLQLDLSGAESLEWQGITLRPRALFGLESRVLGRQPYRFGHEADVSNLDLALGWGRMADPVILSDFSISQSGRFYFWRARELPIPATEVIRSSANMHMIAANESVRAELRRLRPGDHVRLQGVLVDVHWSDGRSWKTSLTRDDSGAGACEIVWVHRLERLP